MTNYRTVNYTTEMMNDENMKVNVFGSAMVKDIAELAKNLSKKARWVHIYAVGIYGEEYDFSYNHKLGYRQWEKVEYIG